MVEACWRVYAAFDVVQQIPTFLRGVDTLNHVSSSYSGPQSPAFYYGPNVPHTHMSGLLGPVPRGCTQAQRSIHYFNISLEQGRPPLLDSSHLLTEPSLWQFTHVG